MDYSPWSLKNLIDRNRLKKFRQVGIDVTCMYTSFGGRGLSSFGDMATFQKRPNFPFGAWTIDPLQKGVVRLRTAILEYNKKMAHSFYTRSAPSCKLVFMGETFVGRLLDLFSTKIKA